MATREHSFYFCQFVWAAEKLFEKTVWVISVLYVSEPENCTPVVCFVYTSKSCMKLRLRGPFSLFRNTIPDLYPSTVTRQQCREPCGPLSPMEPQQARNLKQQGSHWKGTDHQYKRGCGLRDHPLTNILTKNIRTKTAASHYNWHLTETKQAVCRRCSTVMYYVSEKGWKAHGTSERKTDHRKAPVVLLG